jgi:hypothetical protein
MTTPSAIDRPSGVPFRRKVAAWVAIVAARPLSWLPPRHIGAALRVLRRGAREATLREAKAARDAVCAASLTCAAPRGCLPRSLAAAMLCRMWGTWPTWCTGVRTAPPFGAHAWVEIDGHPVDEDVPDDYFSRLMVVTPQVSG